MDHFKFVKLFLDENQRLEISFRNAYHIVASADVFFRSSLLHGRNIYNNRFGIDFIQYEKRA